MKTIRYLLERVVSDGTGSPAGSDRFKSAGKTGTAQISQGAAGYKSGKTTHMVSFCGYFPADNPMYSCIVSIRTSAESKLPASGGSMAGPVFREISEKLMFMCTRNDIGQAVDTVRTAVPGILNGNLQNASTVLRGLGMSKQNRIAGKETADEEFGRIYYENGRFLSEKETFKPGYIPNVVGMGAQDALYMLEKSGYKVEMHGVGKVRTQEPHGGQYGHTGLTVRITLDMM